MEEGSDTDEENWYMLNEDRSDKDGSSLRSDETDDPDHESEMPVEGLSEDGEQSQADSYVDAYCMKCHQMWIDDDEGVTLTWIQCSVCNNWIHELCLPNDYYL